MLVGDSPGSRSSGREQPLPGGSEPHPWVLTFGLLLRAGDSERRMASKELLHGDILMSELIQKALTLCSGRLQGSTRDRRMTAICQARKSLVTDWHVEALTGRLGVRPAHG